MDLEAEGQINYNQTNMLNFFALRKQLPVDTALFLGPELDQYVTLFFRQMTIDWYKKPDEGRFKYVEFPAK